MSLFQQMETKFFPRDVIGRKPKKVGDKFKASFMGMVHTFEVTEFYGDFFMAVVSA